MPIYAHSIRSSLIVKYHRLNLLRKQDTMQRISLIAVAIVLIGIFKTSQSCSCVPNPPSPSQSFKDAQVVFIGQAINVTENAETYERRILFKARRIFKSPDCSKKYYVIYTALDSAMCGVYIQQGEWWQIWAYRTSGKLTTYLCSRSTTNLSANRAFLNSKTCS